MWSLVDAGAFSCLHDPVLALLPTYCFLYHISQSCCMHVRTTSVQVLKLAVDLLQDT